MIRHAGEKVKDTAGCGVVRRSGGVARFSSSEPTGQRLTPYLFDKDVADFVSTLAAPALLHEWSLGYWAEKKKENGRQKEAA